MCSNWLYLCHSVWLEEAYSHVSRSGSPTFERIAVPDARPRPPDNLPPSRSAQNWKSDYESNFTPITFVRELRWDLLSTRLLWPKSFNTFQSKQLIPVSAALNRHLIERRSVESTPAPRMSYRQRRVHQLGPRSMSQIILLLHSFQAPGKSAGLSISYVLYCCGNEVVMLFCKWKMNFFHGKMTFEFSFCFNVTFSVNIPQGNGPRMLISGL